jgi:hypothetical protein
MRPLDGQGTCHIVTFVINVIQSSFSLSTLLDSLPQSNYHERCTLSSDTKDSQLKSDIRIYPIREIIFDIGSVKIGVLYFVR